MQVARELQELGLPGEDSKRVLTGKKKIWQCHPPWGATGLWFGAGKGGGGSGEGARSVTTDGGTCWLCGGTRGSGSREAVFPHGLLVVAFRSVPTQRGPRDPPQHFWVGSSRWAGGAGRGCWHFPAAVPQPWSLVAARVDWPWCAPSHPFSSVSKFVVKVFLATSSFVFQPGSLLKQTMRKSALKCFLPSLCPSPHRQPHPPRPWRKRLSLPRSCLAKVNKMKLQ